LEGFCIRGFEKDQIPGRHLGGVLADSIVDAVLFGLLMGFDSRGREAQ